MSLHRMEAEELQGSWSVKQFSKSLQEFSYGKMYAYFAGASAAVLAKILTPVHNFLSGVLGCMLISTDQFLSGLQASRSRALKKSCFRKCLASS